MTRIHVQWTMTVFTLVLAFLPGQVLAQESRLAGQAIHCAAIFSWLGKTYSAESERGARSGKAVEIFTDVHFKEISGKTGDSGREISLRRRSEEAQALQGPWLAMDASLMEHAVICGAWAEGFLAQGAAYQYVPVYPKVVPSAVRNQYQTWVSEAMGH